MSERIIVYGRVPTPGRVKTRLARAVGDTAAAGVYRLLLEHVLAEARAAGPAVTLALADPPTPGDAWQPPSGVEVEFQEPGDLGFRMLRTFEKHLSAGAGTVVLVGSDLPGLGAAMLLDAFAALGRAPVVLGPSVDGGYWLVGQRRPARDLFTGVPWSSPGVLQATRRRLRELGVPHEELPPLRDLDTISDLDAVVADPTANERLRRRISEMVRDRGGR